MPAFLVVGRFPLPQLGVEAIRFRHATGMEHWHLDADDPHRAVAIALRTPPDDARGLPHLLEHVALCGSRRYPVRDPFFHMTRRSLATYLNAETHPDVTIYPFASRALADIRHLLAVYLDAVFAPQLLAADFLQEGHRLERHGDDWRRTGVVFNEMLGALGGVEAQVEWATLAALLPASCHRFDSGGDPTAIPLATHADLVAYHRRCYRPANALIVTYGALDPAEVHAALAPYLGDGGTALPPPAAQPALGKAQDQSVSVPQRPGEDQEDAGLVSWSWALGDAADLDTALAGELLDRVLLGHPGAPLRRALDGCGFASGSGASGYGAHHRTGLFTAELEGCHPDDHHRLRPLVESCLRGLVEDGIAAEELEAALHQLVYARRELGGESGPLGLELISRIAHPWCWGADPLPFLDQRAAVDRLVTLARQPGWTERLIRERLLDNPHRVLVRGVPDPHWDQRRAEAIARLDSAEVARRPEAELVADLAALTSRQAQTDDPALLPCLSRADVPGTRAWSALTADRDGWIAAAPTGGIVHLLAAVPVPADAPEILAIFAETLSQLGAGGVDHARRSRRIAATIGALNAWIEIAGDPANPAAVRPFLVVEARGLAERTQAVVDELVTTLHAVSFTETERLAEVCAQGRSRLRSRAAEHGTAYAIRAATRGLAGPAGLLHAAAGLGRLPLLDQAREDAGPLAARLAGLAAAVASGAVRLAAIGAPADAERAIRLAAGRIRATRDPLPTFLAPAGDAPAHAAWSVGGAVCHIAGILPGPDLADPDAAALAVGLRYATDTDLHPRLREQGGAYGGGVSYLPGLSVIAATTYRDPRLDASIDDLADGLRRLVDLPDDHRRLHEASLGLLQGIDGGAGPVGEARARILAEWTGGTAALDAYRAGVLAATPERIRAAAARWLHPGRFRLAVIGGGDALAATTRTWERHHLDDDGD